MPRIYDLDRMGILLFDFHIVGDRVCFPLLVTLAALSLGRTAGWNRAAGNV
jgi:hypothetical protein